MTHNRLPLAKGRAAHPIVTAGGSLPKTPLMAPPSHSG
jgi:hypothetical protein